MTRRIEYGARYPEVMGGTKFVVDGPKPREQALTVVNYVNKNLRSKGYEETAELVMRVVDVGPWEPANTGIVPPWLGDSPTGS